MGATGEVSAFHSGQAFHFMTQLSNGEIVVEDYYNLNNNGFGALYKLPPQPPAGQPQFHSAIPADNPSIARTTASGLNYPWKMPFTPRGFVSMTPFTTPGDASTLPAGASANAADLDYTGDIMPPPRSGYPPLSEDEKMLIARWVDLGCPINTGSGGDEDYGWFADELPPTLTISSPRPNKHVAPLTEIRIGVADAYTGVQSGSLSVKAGFTVNGAAPSTELANQGRFVSAGIFVIPLQTPILNLEETTLTVSVRDTQGNKEQTTVRFWVKPAEFSLHRCDLTELPQRRLTLHVRDDSPNPRHRIVATGDLDAPIWSSVSLLGTVQHDDRYEYRVEVPPQFAGRWFLRAERVP